MKLVDTFPTIQVLDQHFEPRNNLDSFGYTNTILDELTDNDVPIIHFWTLSNTVILGLTDQRLPFLDDALKSLSTAGINYFVRNSGGLAVVSDDGILNTSLFIPNSLSLSIDEAYQEMADLIQLSFPELCIHTGEVSNSYCPGTFDLSISGKKIGGLSQRRNQHGIVIMLYLSVSGNQPNRGESIANMYQAGMQNAVNNWNFPIVDASTMINLNSQLPGSLTVGDTKKRILHSLSKINLQPFNETTDFASKLQLQIKSMETRQTKLESRRHI